MLNCPKCNNALDAGILKNPGLNDCPGCRMPIRVDLYPAFFREGVEGSAGEHVALEDEASCFYHPAKRAETVCHECGRFLCGLCDIELNGRHLCTACMAIGREKGRIKDLQNHRVLYDTTALFIAIVPIITIWLTLITAPLAFFLAIRYWKAPSSIIKRTKLRFILVFLISGAQMTAWFFAGYSIFSS